MKKLQIQKLYWMTRKPIDSRNNALNYLEMQINNPRYRVMYEFEPIRKKVYDFRVDTCNKLCKVKQKTQRALEFGQPYLCDKCFFFVKKEYEGVGQFGSCVGCGMLYDKHKTWDGKTTRKKAHDCGQTKRDLNNIEEFKKQIEFLNQDETITLKEYAGVIPEIWAILGEEPQGVIKHKKIDMIYHCLDATEAFCYQKILDVINNPEELENEMTLFRLANEKEKQDN